MSFEDRQHWELRRRRKKQTKRSKAVEAVPEVRKSTMTMTRSFEQFEPLQLRDDGRSVYGLVVPWNTASSITERNAAGEIETYDEAFLPTSFSQMETIAKKRKNWGWIALRMDHDPSMDARVGFARSVTVDKKGAYADFRLYDGPQLEKVRSMLSESHTGLSVEFVDTAKPRRSDGGTVLRTQVYVSGVAATPMPAYTDAAVLAMREDVDVPPLRTPANDAVAEWLAGQ